MFKHLTISLAFVCFALTVNAGIIPFDGATDAELEGLFGKIYSTSVTNPRDAVRLSAMLLTESRGRSENVRIWATVTHAMVLLESDSLTKAAALLDSAVVTPETIEPWIRAYHALGLGIVQMLRAEHREAGRLFRSGLSLLNDKNELLRILLIQRLAENLGYKGKYDQSQGKWYEALSLSEKFGDSTAIVNCYLGRGIVRGLSHDQLNAETDLQLSFNCFKRWGNRKKTTVALIHLGLLELHRGRFELAIEMNLEAYARTVGKGVSDLRGRGGSLHHLGMAYMGLKSWNQALRYLEEAVEAKTRASDLTRMAAIFNDMGRCHQELGNWNEAKRLFELSLKKAQESTQMAVVINASDNIIALHASKGEHQRAFVLQSALLNLKDSLSKAERNESITELEVKYETEKKEREIMMLQQQQAIITNRWLTLAIGLFLTIIIGILFADNQKRKHRQQTQLLLKEDELRKAEIKIMTDLLEYNQKKLTLYTDNLLKKNELVGQLETRLKGAVDGSVGADHEQEKLIEDFSSVRILTDDDWEEFKMLFDGVHRGMLDRLLRSYANLTLAEQRLFLLLKLDLSTKEIANILGVSPESVKKGRYRLKKKIGMEDDTSLQAFVSSF